MSLLKEDSIKKRLLITCFRQEFFMSFPLTGFLNSNMNSQQYQEAKFAKPKGGRFKILNDKYFLIKRINKMEAIALLEQKGIQVKFSSYESEILYVVGKGYHGKLYLVQKINTSEKISFNEFLGAKRTKANSNDDPNIRESEQEANLQKLLKNLPNIMPLQDFIKIEGKKSITYLIMPLAGLGTVSAFKAHFVSLEDEIFKTEITLHIAQSLLNGIKQMHTKGIAHLDVKLDNLVIDNKGEVFLIDFGCAKDVSSSKGLITQNVKGDYNYYSPQR